MDRNNYILLENYTNLDFVVWDRNTYRWLGNGTGLAFDINKKKYFYLSCSLKNNNLHSFKSLIKHFEKNELLNYLKNNNAPILFFIYWIKFHLIKKKNFKNLIKN